MMCTWYMVYTCRYVYKAYNSSRLGLLAVRELMVVRRRGRRQ